MEKTDDIVPLRPWDTGPGAGRQFSPEQIAFDRKERVLANVMRERVAAPVPVADHQQPGSLAA